jgi:hypothetical protein
VAEPPQGDRASDEHHDGTDGENDGDHFEGLGVTRFTAQASCHTSTVLATGATEERKFSAPLTVTT